MIHLWTINPQKPEQYRLLHKFNLNSRASLLSRKMKHFWSAGLLITYHHYWGSCHGPRTRPFHIWRRSSRWKKPSFWHTSLHLACWTRIFFLINNCFQRVGYAWKMRCVCIDNLFFFEFLFRRILPLKFTLWFIDSLEHHLPTTTVFS